MYAQPEGMKTAARAPMAHGIGSPVGNTTGADLVRPRQSGLAGDIVEPALRGFVCNAVGLHVAAP